MEVLIVLGDQDGYHEAEHEVVSSPIWLSGDPGRRGHQKALFVVQARRAEILLERARSDVIACDPAARARPAPPNTAPNLPEARRGARLG